MAQDGKLGTFGGVYTPSLLTILGVIMYLRLPWVVGNSGLTLGIGIILVAHVISVCTGLSISSIATDKKVGAGGPYYIVSRSLGLPIGGTLGLALFVGLSFSISLYIIGFCESFLAFWGFEVNPTTIRIAGTVTSLVLTVVTLISTALAIKTQYLIFVLIAGSLVSIFLGSHPVPPETPQLKPIAGGESLATLFGIFFPAVTGFTAGVNMSGDLKNPTRSLPRGTMAAILTGMAIYIGLAWFFASRVPAKDLIEDSEILLKIAWYPPAVVAGIWGATLSSGLGCILGAPRILQAVSSDRVIPKWFAKGHGPTNEPRNALLVAFALGEAGILIAELDAIARIVSMVFLTTYGFLNISCAVESWVSPDFRPAFKIPNMVSVLGAVVCLLIMIQLDLLAMLGATVLMVGVFLLLSRRQLTLDAGDAWEGVWSALIRSGLYRLTRGTRHGRNWRPNILLFRPPDAGVRSSLRSMASRLITGNGMLTELELSDGDPDAADGVDDPPVGVFVERIAKGDVYETITNVCRFRGFAGLTPNTVLLDWSSFRHDPERFGEMLDVISQLDHNVLLYASGSPERERARRVDVWWRPGAGNVMLSISLLRFITRSPEFRDASLRFILLCHDTSLSDHLRATMRSLLSEARLDASVRLVNNTLGHALGDGKGSFEQLVKSESSDAALTLVGLPNDPDECGPRFQERVDEMMGSLAEVLLIRGSSSFEEVLRLSRQASISLLPPAEAGQRAELPAIELPQPPELARPVAELAERYQRHFSRFHRGCLRRVYGHDIKLVKRIKGVVEKQFGQLERALAGANPRRRRNLVNRMQSSLLLECSKVLDAAIEKGLSEQRATLEGRIAAFLKAKGVGDADAGEWVLVRRPKGDFAPSPDDSPQLARFKRRRRWASILSRRTVSYRVPIGQLRAFTFERAVSEALSDSVRQFVTDSHHLVVHLGKVLSSPRISESLGEALETDALELAMEREKSDLLASLDRLIEHNQQRVGGHQWRLLHLSREIVQAFASDLNRLDVSRVAGERAIDVKKARSLRAELKALPGNWFDNQQLILERAKLGLSLSTFQHRLASIVQREKSSLVLTVKNGVLGECKELLAGLHRFVEQLAVGSELCRRGLAVRADFDRRFDVDHVLDALVQSTADLASELPQWERTLSDDSIARLEEGQIGEVETVEIPVFRLAQFLIEAKLIGAVQAELEKLPHLEARAAGVARDVTRLVAFQLSELESAGDATPETMATQLGPVVESGIERIEAEIEALEQALASLLETLDEQLRVVIEGTNTYELSRTSADLDHHIRRHQGKRAVSGVRYLLERGRETLKGAMVQLLYRRSSGVLMARELRAQGSHNGTLVDAVLGLVEQHMPRQDTLEQLPFYYRQLFAGQATVNETFWVGRDKQLAQAKRAVANFGRGANGAIIVTGQRGSGKTSLLTRVTSELLARRHVVRVFPPRSGSADPTEFAGALSKATGIAGEPREVLASIPDGSAIVIDDLELWWERSDGGLAVIDAILDLMEHKSERTLFLLALSNHAFSFINRFRRLGDNALAVLECGPLPADDLKRIISLRHGSTGLKFALGERSEEQLSDWALARLFTSHFDYSRGYVGTALHSWIAHVRKVNDATLIIDAPQVKNWELLDELRPEWVAVLLQLVLHKRLERHQLGDVSAVPRAQLDHDVDTLARMGLVTESAQGVLEINPYVCHMVIDRFNQRGIL